MAKSGGKPCVGKLGTPPLNFVLFTLDILSLDILLFTRYLLFNLKMTQTLKISSCFGKGSEVYGNIFREGNIYAIISWILSYRF